MKKLILFMLLVSSVFGKDLYLDFYAHSNHFDKNYDYNESHDFIGLSLDTDYKLFNKDYLKLGLSAATFENSYYDRTYMLGTYIKSELFKTSISDINISLGAQIDVGLQKGYCNYGREACSKNEDDFSAYIVPSLYTEVERAKVNFYFYPDEVFVIKGSFKVYEF